MSHWREAVAVERLLYAPGPSLWSRYGGSAYDDTACLERPRVSREACLSSEVTGLTPLARRKVWKGGLR